MANNVIAFLTNLERFGIQASKRGSERFQVSVNGESQGEMGLSDLIRLANPIVKTSSDQEAKNQVLAILLELVSDSFDLIDSLEYRVAFYC